MKHLFIIFILLVPAFLLANFIATNTGSRAQGMGNAYAGLADDASAVFFNPAGISQLKKNNIIFSHENMYGVDNLYNEMLSFVMPTSLITYGFSSRATTLLDEYAEYTSTLSAAGKLYINGNKLHLGINLKHFHVSVPGYHGAKTINEPHLFDFDVGVLYTIKKGFKLGLVGRNIFANKVKLISDKDSIDREYTIGVAYYWRETVNFALDYNWRGDETFACFGAEMWFYEVFAPRIGMYNNRLTAGIGLKHDYWTIDASVLSNDGLGSTYRLTAGVQFSWDGR